ncbi:MAG TPA: ABC transporter permease [Candidatus Sulfotelmatobacter sp.]|nr:ABC transporter permease [Candidatus Sulfotelmatobacter sp.]
MNGVAQDLRHALRQFRKSPGFFSMAVLTLALGIGANTAIFSMVDWLVLRPLPIRDPGQMTYLVVSGGVGESEPQFSYPEFAEIRKQGGEVFSGMSSFIFGGLEGAQSAPNGLTWNGVTKPVQTVYVGGDFFSLLGIQPYLGRFILPAEGVVAGADPVVVLSYNCWRSRFDGDQSVIGKTAFINGTAVSVVGVAPKGFLGLTPLVETEAYLPLGMYSIERGTARDFLNNPKTRDMIVFGRLKAGTTLEQAQSAVAVVGTRMLRQYPRESGNRELQAKAMRPPGLITGENPLPKLAALFLILAGTVLALACVNVANLFLVRAGIRQREMAMRAALGALRGRLIRQLLTESLLLAGIGCIAGVLLGVGGSRLLSALPVQTELPLVLDFSFDWRVFAYALAVALATGMVVGIVPALRLSRGNLSEVLHEGGRTSSGGRQRMRSILVGVEVGGSLALLIAAGLLVRSMQGVERADLGFDPKGVLNLTVDPNGIGYSEAQAKPLFREILERTRALPGVQSASLASAVPLSESVSGADLVVPGYAVVKGQGAPHAENNSVSSGYFETMGMRLLRGRELNDGDNENSARVAVINQAMAERYWPGQDPLGRSFAIAEDTGHPISIVGVVKNSRMSEAYGAYEPIFYLPIAQHYLPVQTLQVRTAQAPQAMVPEIQQVVQSLVPAMPVYGVRTMTAALQGINGLLLFEVGAGLAAALGLLGLALAIVGVYGVMSYSVSQRTREIGLRMAVGAQRGDILRMVGRGGLLMVGGGLLVGLVAAFAVGRLVSDFLVEVTPGDPVTFVSVSLLLVFVALIAGYVPARRAMKVDPMVALRYE